MTRRVILVWSAVIVSVTVALLAHLALRFEVVRLGYDVSRERRAESRLTESKRLLSIEAAALAEPRRVEAIAREQLQLTDPRPEQIVPARLSSNGGASR